MSLDWTEKYRPESLSNVIGNPSVVNDLKAWAVAWQNGKPKNKAVVLIGTPGIGKTTSALALAKDMGWDVVEMNASDQRTEGAIKDVAIRGSGYNAFTADGEYKSRDEGKLKLIILDEADNLFGNADRGGASAIGQLIKETKQPVILIVNDFYALSKKSAAIKTETLQLTFKRPVKSTMVKALRNICVAEGVEASDDTLMQIAENSNGDMRAAVRDLESLGLGKKILDSADAEQLSNRESRKSMSDLMYYVFRNPNPMKAREITRDIDEEPSRIMLDIDENLPYEFRDPGDLVRGYEKLSRADIYLGRVMRRMHYGFWSYANEMMTSGVATAKRSSYVNREWYKFPSYMTKLSRSRGVRATKATLCQKLADYIHTSTGRVAKDVLPELKMMMANDAELRLTLTKELELEPDELAFLLESKVDSKAVKDVYKQLEVKPEKEEPIKEAKVKAPKAKAEPVKEEKPARPTADASKGQKSLFDW